MIEVYFSQDGSLASLDAKALSRCFFKYGCECACTPIEIIGYDPYLANACITLNDGIDIISNAFSLDVYFRVTNNETEEEILFNTYYDAEEYLENLENEEEEILEEEEN